jgi:Ni,Fe-hydrogenase I cytochrome b subunit
MNSEKSDNSQKDSVFKNKPVFQVIYGIALTLAGIGVFYRIPQVMPKVEQIQQFSSVIGFIRFCFYLMGVILIGGGIKKIYVNYKKL